MLTYIMAGTCGSEEECGPEDQLAGAVWQCQACGIVTAAIYTKRGKKVWVKLDPYEVEFYDILKIEDRESE